MSLPAKASSPAPGHIKALSEASGLLNKAAPVPPAEGKTTQERFQEFQRKRQQLVENPEADMMSQGGPSREGRFLRAVMGLRGVVAQPGGQAARGATQPTPEKVLPASGVLRRPGSGRASQTSQQPATGPKGPLSQSNPLTSASVSASQPGENPQCSGVQAPRKVASTGPGLLGNQEGGLQEAHGISPVTEKPLLVSEQATRGTPGVAPRLQQQQSLGRRTPPSSKFDDSLFGDSNDIDDDDLLTEELDEPIMEMPQLSQADARGIRRSVSVGGARLAETRAGKGMEAAAAAATAAAAAAGHLQGAGDAGRGGDGMPSRIGIRRVDTTSASAGGWPGSQQLLNQQQQQQHLEPAVARAMLNSQRYTSPQNERMVRRAGPPPGMPAANQQRLGPGARPAARAFNSQPPSPAGKFPPGNPAARNGRYPPTMAAAMSRTHQDNSLGVSPVSQQSMAVPDTSLPVAPSRIKVVVRKRPLNRRELARSEFDVIAMDPPSRLTVQEPKTKVDLQKYTERHDFRFDAVFDEHVTNDEVYRETVGPIVPAIFDKTKATCFAYGQTGSGKTHTMQPLPLRATEDFLAILAQHEGEGLELWISSFEIYGGKLFDLLHNRNKLQMREDGRGQVCIVGLEEVQVSSVERVRQLILQGNASRSTGSTGANEESSRSHAILQMAIKRRPSKADLEDLRARSRRARTSLGHPNDASDAAKPQLVGKLSFIDLAGSERGADTTDSNKQTRMEGAEINKSLLALKECIRALGAEQSHVPFRGSKLTEVLRDSFTGKSCTVMLSCISPGSLSVEHTLNTLRYTDRVKALPRAGSQGGGGASGLARSSKAAPPSASPPLAPGAGGATVAVSATSSWKSTEQPDDRGSSLQEPLRAALGAALQSNARLMQQHLQPGAGRPYPPVATAPSVPSYNVLSGLGGGDIAPDWAGAGTFAASGYSGMGAPEMGGEECLEPAYDDASFLSSRYLPGGPSGASFAHPGATQGRQEPARPWRRDATPERNATLAALYAARAEQAEGGLMVAPEHEAVGSQTARAQGAGPREHWEGTGSTGAGWNQGSTALSGAYPRGDTGEHDVVPHGAWRTGSSAAATAPAGPASGQAARQHFPAQRFGLPSGGPEYGSSNALEAHGGWNMATLPGATAAADAAQGMGDDGQWALQGGLRKEARTVSSGSNSNSTGSSSSNSCEETTKESRDAAASGHATSHAAEAALQKAPAPATAGTAIPAWQGTLEEDERESSASGKQQGRARAQLLATSTAHALGSTSEDCRDAVAGSAGENDGLKLGAEERAAAAGSKSRGRQEGQEQKQRGRHGKGRGGEDSLAAGAGEAAGEEEGAKEASAPAAAPAPTGGSTRRTRKGTWAAPAAEAPLLRSTSSGASKDQEREKEQGAEAPDTSSSAGAAAQASPPQDEAPAGAGKGARRAQPVASRTRSSRQKGAEASAVAAPAAGTPSREQSKSRGGPASSAYRRGKSQERGRGRGQEDGEKADEKENQAYGEEAPVVRRLDSDTSSSLPGSRQPSEAAPEIDELVSLHRTNVEELKASLMQEVELLERMEERTCSVEDYKSALKALLASRILVSETFKNRLCV